MNYQPDFLNFREIFTNTEKQYLAELSQKIDINKLLDNPRNVEEIGIDFVYSSAQLEGNTYTKYETLHLLKMGQTAGGKLYSDAIMLINLRDSYQFLLANLKNEQLNLKEFIKDTHSIISQNLVKKGMSGVVRDESVYISGTDYRPLVSAQKLDSEMNYLLNIAEKYENPFEKALYLHNNIAYLQYFIDCNKRTGRNLMNFILLNNNIFPCLFSESSQKANEYINSLIYYYETGDYYQFKLFFIETFEKSIQKYTIEDIEINRQRSEENQNA